MSRPAWQRAAESVYAMLLHLYPRSLRERHGEDMRQAFRDRCREVSEGRTSAWRLFCLEMAPDFAASVGGAHLDVPGTPRMRASLLALAVLAGMWFFQDALSPRLLDAWFAAKLRWVHWQETRAFERDERRVRGLADRLVASPSDHERALAAFLYAINYANRTHTATYVPGASEHLEFAPVAEDGERATRVVASLANTQDIAAARAALIACQFNAGCDRAVRAQALVRVEPRNAYAWSQLLALHGKAGDEAALRLDLQGIAASTHFSDGMPQLRQSILAASSRLAPGDAAMAAALGRQLLLADAMVVEDFEYSLFIQCSQRSGDSSAPPSWLQRHPEARAQCSAAAGLLAQSGPGWPSLWGWRWLDRNEPSARTAVGLRAAGERLRSTRDIGRTRVGEHGWTPWTDGEWLAWAQSQQSAN